MSYVNLPPNLQDIFNDINDRVARLESGPNGPEIEAEAAQETAVSAQFTALYSQSVATTAQIDAINAGIAANNAASQATIAQTQATIANTNATIAQATANGKNKVTYSTSAPGSTANSLGDIWYQYGTSGTYANKVIAQYSGLGGTSWTSVTVSGLVIANIDAGAITTGTLSAIQITAGSGTQLFSVSSAGAMVANGAVITGNITATSGTFTGSIRADTGYFGTGTGATLTNGWSIGASGLTGVGTATITGGQINGSSITVGTGVTTGFTVNAAGYMTATGANITGAITATSGSFAGTINATAGYFGSVTNGWTITSTGISGTGSATITGGAISGATLTLGSAFSVSGSGFLTSTGAQIGPWYFGSNYISSINGGTGYYWSSASGALSTNNLFITGTSGTTISMSGGNIFTGGGNVTAGAGTISASTGTISGASLVSTGTLNVSGLSTMADITGDKITANGNFFAVSAAYIQDVSTTTFAGNARIDVGDGRLRRSTASSIRFKDDITNIVNVANLNPKKLLDLPVRAFRFKENYLDSTDERAGLLVPGFVAEEVAKFYPAAADSIKGEVENWNERFLIPGMLSLIQDQEKRIQLLEGN